MEDNFKKWYKEWTNNPETDLLDDYSVIQFAKYCLEQQRKELLEALPSAREIAEQDLFRSNLVETGAQWMRDDLEKILKQSDD